MLFDAAFRPSFVARLRLSPRLGRIFFNKQTSNQLDAQLVIAIYEGKIYTQIGNAVPCKMAEAVAKAVIAYLDSEWNS